MTQIAVDAIVARVVEALQADAALAGASVLEEADVTLVPEDVQRAVSVSWGGSYPDRVTLSGHPTSWTSTVRVSVFARRDQATAGQRASRSLAAECFRVVMGLRTDAALLAAGLLDIAPPQMVPNGELLGTKLGAVDLDFSVTHQTAPGRLTYA